MVRALAHCKPAYTRIPKAWGWGSYRGSLIVFSLFFKINMVISLFSFSKSSTQPTTSALDRKTSSMFHSYLEHQLVTHFVLPVSDFWQFGPWWIPKLGNQPTLGLHPKFSLFSSPLDRFDSCGVRQAIYFICSDNISFGFENLDQPNQTWWACLLAGWSFFSTDANPGKNSKFASSTCN